MLLNDPKECSNDWIWFCFSKLVISKAVIDIFTIVVLVTRCYNVFPLYYMCNTIGNKVQP